jgi:hypothetical protein
MGTYFFFSLLDYSNAYLLPIYYKQVDTTTIRVSVAHGAAAASEDQDSLDLNPNAHN